MGREEARVRDRMREFFPDAKQARSPENGYYHTNGWIVLHSRYMAEILLQIITAHNA